MRSISRIISIIAIAVVPCIPVMRADGIAFESLTLPEAQAKAAEEGKLVFVDCYTPTCGPCKYMARNIFPLDTCGAYMNPRFVSVMKDLEAEENRYIARDYNVRIYPTFLLVRPDGSLYYRIEGGAVKQPEKFITRVENALRLGDMNARYDKGERSVEFVSEYIKAIGKNEPARQRRVLDEYIPTLSATQVASPEVWSCIDRITSTDCAAFRHIFGLISEIAPICGKDVAGGALLRVYTNEFNNKKMSPDIDFRPRIADLKALEKDSIVHTGFLKEKMLFRHVINRRDNSRLTDVAHAIARIGASDAPESARLEALAELRGINKLIGAGSGNPIRKALRATVGAMSENSRKRLSSLGL